MVIGSYYVQIKNAHIFWGEMRRTTTRGKRAGESYIAIPANYAYEYNIKKGERYVCLCDNGKKYNLKAAGSQNKREFAKQFQGDGSLKVLYEWYKYHDAQEGDYVLVIIFDDKSIAIEYVSKEDVKRLNEYGIAGERGRMQEVEERKEKGFRLLLLLVKDGDVEHCNIEFIKSEYDNSIQEPITTVLIGVNGSGKSFVLKTISEIFNAIQNSNAMAQLKYSHYEMKYVIDGNVIDLGYGK